jgi:hypothetical protein
MPPPVTAPQATVSGSPGKGEPDVATFGLVGAGPAPGAVAGYRPQ